MATLSYSPSYPSPGEGVTLSLGSAAPNETGRYELTSVPDASSLTTGALVDAAGAPVDTFTADVAGAYGVKAYVYRRYSGIPAYAGDPAGEARDLLVSTATGTVYVGNASLLTIAALGSAVDLRIFVADGTVRGASLVNPTTEIARLAALDSTVGAAVAALEGVAVGSLGEDLFADVEALRAAAYSHAAKNTDSVHLGLDDINRLEPKTIQSIPGAIDRLNALYDAILGHLDNNGGTWHTTPDRTNMPIAAKATDRQSATVLLADLRRRVYMRHKATVGSPAVHGAADAGNDVTADSPLTAAIVAVLDYFAAMPPATPAGENAGHAGALEYGFIPEPI